MGKLAIEASTRPASRRRKIVQCRQSSTRAHSLARAETARPQRRRTRIARRSAVFSDPAYARSARRRAPSVAARHRSRIRRTTTEVSGWSSSSNAGTRASAYRSVARPLSRALLRAPATARSRDKRFPSVVVKVVVKRVVFATRTSRHLATVVPGGDSDAAEESNKAAQISASSALWSLRSHAARRTRSRPANRRQRLTLRDDDDDDKRTDSAASTSRSTSLSRKPESTAASLRTTSIGTASSEASQASMIRGVNSRRALPRTRPSSVARQARRHRSIAAARPSRRFFARQASKADSSTAAAQRRTRGVRAKVSSSSSFRDDDDDVAAAHSLTRSGEKRSLS
mmetsp:Transcript_7782/g.25549  ORF Transcript_7782/g.25549 Transcript_7782/m.25549 type:complete len:342 (-) Transcript_7782:498-1523(-)